MPHNHMHPPPAPITRRQFVGATTAAAVLAGLRPTSQLHAATPASRHQLFWGDLHNHNAVGYAKGSLERSIDLARAHLDFFAFTGHASWHDMPQMAGDRHMIWVNGFKAHSDHCRRALIDGAAEADYVCVLQDDVILSDSLRGVVEEMVQHSGEHPIGLYAGTSTMASSAMDHDPDPWWAATGPIWGSSVVIPSMHVDGILEHGAKLNGSTYDGRLWRYFERQGILCYYSNPSLVQHRTGHGSLMRRSRGDRVAQSFGSGVGKDWSREPVILGRHQLHPRVNVWKDNRRRPVRKHSKQWRDAIAAGWAER